MATKIDIANQALSHLGVGKEITSLTERSEEARALNRFYDVALDALLSEFDWPFARKEAALNEAESEPVEGWSYAYRYPADCVSLRRMVSGIHPEDKDSQIKYAQGKDDLGQVIYTNQPDAVAQYTTNDVPESQFPADFGMALSYRLAALIAPRLSGADSIKLIDASLKLYEMYAARAKARTANESKRPMPGGSE